MTAEIAGAGRLVAALLAIAGLSGCAAGPELSIPLTARDSGHARVMWLRAHPDKDGVLLRGHVRRPPSPVVPTGGHLHVMARKSGGSPPLIADSWQRPGWSRSRRMAPFSILLRTENPELIADITVEYRAAPDAAD